MGFFFLILNKIKVYCLWVLPDVYGNFHRTLLSSKERYLKTDLDHQVIPERRYIELSFVSVICSQLHCTVPAYNFPVTALAIAPSTNNLVIAHSDQQVRDTSTF